MCFLTTLCTGSYLLLGLAVSGVRETLLVALPVAARVPGSQVRGPQPSQRRASHGVSDGRTGFFAWRLGGLVKTQQKEVYPWGRG